MGLIRYPTIRYNWVHALLASNSARYIHCYWSILDSIYEELPLQFSKECCRVIGGIRNCCSFLESSFGSFLSSEVSILMCVRCYTCVRSFEGEVLLYTHCKNIWATWTILRMSQLHACCVCDTLQTSREATNLILNQSVVEKLLPLLN